MVAIAAIVIGSLVSTIAYGMLKDLDLVKSYQDPFTLRQSGYGTMLARLGQKNLEQAWHLGMVASELSQKMGGKDEGHGEDGKGEVHDEEGEGHDEGEGDGANLNEFKHDHDHDHDHEKKQLNEFGGGWLEFLVLLDAERYKRTSWIPMSEEQKKVIAEEIEGLLRKCYEMDPTDYAAYDTYFHFLVYHPLRSTAEDRQLAYKLSEHSIQVVFRKKLDPMPWLTASIATINQFFLHQENLRRDSGNENANLPTDTLALYKDRMNYTLGHFGKLRDQAIADGRWSKVPQERITEAEDRALSCLKMTAQFDAMIKRAAVPKNESPSPPGKQTESEAPEE